MKILAMDKIMPGVTEEDISPHLKEEAAKAWELHTAGIFRELYFRTDQPGVVLIMECADVEEARQILSALPLVRAGLIDFHLIVPLGPFMPFAALFAEEK